MQCDDKSNMIISYITLRNLIGYGGILLPFVCMAGAAFIGGKCIQESVSMYYYSNMRDFFIGLMAVVSLFLVTYKGYCLVDNIVTTSSGVMGLLLALFPCMQSKDATELVGIFMLKQGTSEYIHVTSAAVFFILLALNSIFLFTRSKLKWKDFPCRKKIRNIIYIGCGVIILVALVLLAVLTMVLGSAYVTEHRIPLILEIIMLSAFGVSWLVKGETIFKDRQGEIA
ncbi:MAG TPA: hypothetical protein PK514_11105 [Spirochaetota bacterium]|nr:hypothetical protein [Spirochaetota bacterium]